MKLNKAFDCLKLKDGIQAQLMQARAGMTDKERVAVIDENVAKADSPVARLWRIASSSELIARVAEGSAVYGKSRAKQPLGK